MTLVVANRTDSELSFVADTRISFGQSYFDKGIKLFSVPFKLKGPAKSVEDFDKYEFEHNYGIAVIGNSINAYTIKDTIAEILPNMTYLTNLSDASIITIGSLVLKAYEEISQELAALLGKTGLCEILLGGFCLHQKKIRLLRFYPKILGDTTKYEFEEILPINGILFFGSGKKLAEEFLQKDPDLNPLQIVRKVIDSEQEKSVGGNVQYGAFYKDNFKISGVQEEILNEAGDTIKTTKFRRGFIVQNEFLEALKPPYIFLSYSYKSYKVPYVKDKETK